MKIVFLKKSEMVIPIAKYSNLLIEKHELEKKASPFYKYTPNEIRKMLGLDAISTPKELEKKENKFTIGYDKSNGNDHSALTIIETNSNNERIVKEVFYDDCADMLIRLFESKDVVIVKEEGE